MRKATVRRGLRFMAAGIVSVMVGSFFHHELSQLLSLDFLQQAQVTLFGFLAGGICGAVGVLVAAFGLLQSDREGGRVRLASTVMLLFSLVILFFVLAYNSVMTPRPQRTVPGESISI